MENRIWNDLLMRGISPSRLSVAERDAMGTGIMASVGDGGY